MLGDKDAIANIAVKNLETAKKFYVDTLGLKQIGAEDQELIVLKSLGRQTHWILVQQNQLNKFSRKHTD
jgi:catechol 2,3-dioxygenase-like lactoylglutathione lyase family enzyme